MNPKIKNLIIKTQNELQLPPPQHQSSNTTNISRPPQHRPRKTQRLRLNKHIRKPEQDPRYRVPCPDTIDHVVREACV
ncbi:hypothetical protein BDQ94DRAFT_151069 [Aspergillus welwitschiae]|uniref:Uncharacterized protein n=1 Tax=Aspergillus welwitschiae TaxID=1341132 RepID=A0A3F3PQP4_9EURO|nr:hypothetical protein BDQ94DRAFT_151069 [Aspergillus welwitschiae]RDH29138.1 hypothetical protein BDQ94DRAFT_151069 [Aspergillus welwitschiae]